MIDNDWSKKEKEPPHFSKAGRINSHEGSAIRHEDPHPLVRQNASQNIETSDDITQLIISNG